MYDQIEINKALIPYSFDIVLGDEVFELQVNYNETHDLFTVSLYREGALLCTEPLIYGKVLFSELTGDGFPALSICPLDAADEETAVTWDNLNETVFLSVLDGEADGT